MWNWQTVPAAAYYQVYRGATADFPANQATLVASPAQSDHVDWGLQQGNAYWYRIAPGAVGSLAA